jgi:hypothetical protein
LDPDEVKQLQQLDPPPPKKMNQTSSLNHHLLKSDHLS